MPSAACVTPLMLSSFAALATPKQRQYQPKHEPIASGRKINITGEQNGGGTPRLQNPEIWPPTAPGPQKSDSSCPFHQNSTRGEVGGPKSDRFAAISGFGPCRIPKFCPRIRGGRIYMRTSSTPSATDPYVSRGEGEIFEVWFLACLGPPITVSGLGTMWNGIPVPSISLS